MLVYKLIMETLYKNALVIDGGKKFKASILVENGKIKKIIRSGALPKAQ